MHYPIFAKHLFKETRSLYVKVAQGLSVQLIFHSLKNFYIIFSIVEYMQKKRENLCEEKNVLFKYVHCTYTQNLFLASYSKIELRSYYLGFIRRHIK